MRLATLLGPDLKALQADPAQQQIPENDVQRDAGEEEDDAPVAVIGEEHAVILQDHPRVVVKPAAEQLGALEPSERAIGAFFIDQ